MTARLLDGRDVASHLRRELQHRVERLTDGDPDTAPAARDPPIGVEPRG